MEPKVLIEKSTSRIESREIHYSWTIENFSSSNKKNKEYLRSQAFPKAGNDQNEWFLELYPNGYDEVSKEYISIFLSFSPKEKDSITAQFKFSFTNKNEKILSSLNYYLQDFEVNPKSYGYKTFAKRNTIMSQLQDDVLIVNCSIKWETGIVNVDNETTSLIKPDAQENLSKSFHRLVENGHFSDVSLKCSDGTKFPAHKCVLTVRSQVFAAMFEHNMKESQESVVEIEDINANTLKILLQFIYTGKFDVDNCGMIGLLIAADKYGIEDLKVLCELELVKKLKIKNVIDLLLLADRYNAKLLKTEALELTTKHLKDVLKTKAMKNLSTAQISLFYDILGSIADKLKII